MSSTGDLELNFASDGPTFRRAKAPGRNKHSKTFKKQCQQKQQRRDDRARKPRILKGSAQAAEPSAGSLKGYQLSGPNSQQHKQPHKKARLDVEDLRAGDASQASVSEGKAAEAGEAVPALAASQKRHVVFGGEAKALAELLNSRDDAPFEEEPLEGAEIEEGMTDILAAVQASQLRDRHFAYNPSGQATGDYHSSDEDGDEQAGAGVPFRQLRASPQTQTAGVPLSGLLRQNDKQQEEDVGPKTYKEGLAQSNAAKGPKLQPLGPSETKTFVELGVAQTLSDHLQEYGMSTPRQIQRASVPSLLAGQDVVIQNLEASGKTFAYLVAIINQLQAAEKRISREAGTHAVVLAPSVSICTKVEAALQILLKRYFWLVGGSMHGSEARNKEKARLRRGVTVLVCTPGRLLDHLQHTEAFRTADLRWLVLDDVDQMLQTDAKDQLGQIFKLLRDRSRQPAQHWQNVLVMRKRKLQDWSPLAGLKLDKPVLATC
ncbi:hypothetical protein WJX84_010245, partial [Apatococcus fuscideae]